MYKELLKTEIECNRGILFVSLVLNIFFITIMDRTPEDDPIISFMGATTISFFVLLVVAAITGGEEKRIQLYAQLPVTATESFLVGWFWVLSWLGLQVACWLLYAYSIDPEFLELSPVDIAATALGIWLMMVIVANAIDLGSYKPGYVQWSYIGAIVIFFGIAARYDISVGMVFSDSDIRFFPTGLFESAFSNVVFICSLIATLMIANWYIFTRSDNYLR